MPLDAGQYLHDNRYCIKKALDEGGMGTVYTAMDRRVQGKTVAIKENTMASKAHRDQFQREANLLYRLNHPNLPDITDFFVDEETGRQCLVMEYIDGDDLKTRLTQNGGPLPENEVLGWIGQVMRALEYMHTWSDSQSGKPQPILHRDIKPSNIKCSKRGKIYLVDFGLAKRGTQVTTMIGARGRSPGYSPVEQYAGSEGTTPRSDIYALGATLYTLLTGTKPPASPDIASGKKELIAPRTLNPNIRPNTALVIQQAMNLRPADRYGSIAEMRLALNNTSTLDQFSVNRTTLMSRLGVHRLGTIGRGQPVFLRALIGVLLAAIVVLFAYVLFFEQSETLLDADAPSDTVIDGANSQNANSLGGDEQTKTPTLTVVMTKIETETALPAVATGTSMPEVSEQVAEASEELSVESILSVIEEPSEAPSAPTRVNISNTKNSIGTTPTRRPTSTSTATPTSTSTPTSTPIPTSLPTSTHTRVPTPRPTVAPRPTRVQIAPTVTSTRPRPTSTTVRLSTSTPLPPTATPFTGPVPDAPADKGCYLVQNQLGPEITITLTTSSGRPADTFKVQKSKDKPLCLTPGKYTVTVDAPPPWGDNNFTINVAAGDNMYFPIRTGK